MLLSLTESLILGVLIIHSIKSSPKHKNALKSAPRELSRIRDESEKKNLIKIETHIDQLKSLSKDLKASSLGVVLKIGDL